MLYFTETAWMPEDPYALSHAFDLEYDQDAYECRIAEIVSSLKKRPDHDGKQWKEAQRALKTEDHYLLVFIGPIMQPQVAPDRTWSDSFKLILIALAFIFFIGLAVWAGDYFGAK